MKRMKKKEIKSKYTTVDGIERESEFLDFLVENRDAIKDEIFNFVPKKSEIEPEEYGMHHHKEMLSEYPDRGGKYVRPGLVLLSAMANKTDMTKALKTAAAMVIISLRSWPHYLPFFNLAAGGPSAGHRYFLDSNLDWGQDLVGLKRYMDREQIDRIDLAYAGRVRPELYGIDYDPFLGRGSNHYAVVSANLLWGRMYFMNGTGHWPTNQDLYASFRSREPEAVIGHSLYVFRRRTGP